MHSSRMSTVRCSGRLGGRCLPRGCLPEEVFAQGVSAQGGLPGGLCVADTHPLDRMTDRCKNITVNMGCIELNCS